MKPFADAADEYLAEGWHPFPAYHTREKSKAPCVKAWYVDDKKRSVIGWDAVDVTPELVAGWKAEYPASHIGLRVPRTVLGIDVDDYDGKTGGARLRHLAVQFGALPRTWISTSRRDGSGIWLFRVDDSAQFPNGLGDGIDIVRWCSRFVFAAPSTHPKTGAPYGWIRPDGEFVLDEFPSALSADLAPLPPRWVAGLRTETRQRSRVAGIQPNGVRAWIEGRPGGRGEPCEGMRRTFAKYNRDLAAADQGSRHDAALVGVHALVGDSAEGHRGLYWCLLQLAKVLSAKRGGPGVADEEFMRMVHPEVEKRMAEPVLDDDPCESELAQWLK